MTLYEAIEVLYDFNEILIDTTEETKPGHKTELQEAIELVIAEIANTEKYINEKVIVKQS